MRSQVTCLFFMSIILCPFFGYQIGKARIERYEIKEEIAKNHAEVLQLISGKYQTHAEFLRSVNKAHNNLEGE